MSRLGREIARGMRDLKSAQGPKTFTWEEQEIPCVKSRETKAKSFGPGGFALDYDLELFVEAADLPEEAPAEKDSIVFNGHTYTIETISLLPGDEQLKYSCNDPLRAA